MPRENNKAAGYGTVPSGEPGRDALKAFLRNDDNLFAKSVLESMDREGYVILRGLFSAAEADEAAARQWDFVEKVNPTIRRRSPKTWRKPCGGGQKNDPWPMAQRDMFQLHQAGWLFPDFKEKFAERVFAPLYGTNQLHTSKDGWTFQRPTDGDLDRSPNDHFDQGHHALGLQCIQGSLALTDQDFNDGCFSCWPGSHKFREQLLDTMPESRTQQDFIIMGDPQMRILREAGIESTRIPVRKGDVVLWRSDLLHCGAPPLGARPTFRQVLYVCCLPAALTPDEVYPQKLQAYRELQTGSHWPNREEWFKPNKRVHQLDKIRPYFAAPLVLSTRQQQLHGLVRYPKTESTRPTVLPFAVAADGSLHFEAVSTAY